MTPAPRPRKVLVLGASGMAAPFVTPGLEDDYDLTYADITPHPNEKPIVHVDVTSYKQVADACSGMDAILNFTVNRWDPVLSWKVNLNGACNIMRAAAAHGIRKVVHTGPQQVWSEYGQDFDVEDPPLRPGTSLYMLTKHLALELCRIHARSGQIHTLFFLFFGIEPKPEAPVTGRDFHPFTITHDDLQLACRLALELETVPEWFQSINLLSFLAQGKYRIDKAKRILGFEPQEEVERYYRRPEDNGNPE
jgi:hypothetical protein